MSNHESAKKAYRGSVRKNSVNTNRKSSIKTLTKKLFLLISKKSVQESQDLFKVFQSELLRAVSKKIFKLNNAARKISKMNKRIQSIVLG